MEKTKKVMKKEWKIMELENTNPVLRFLILP